MFSAAKSAASSAHYLLLPGDIVSKFSSSTRAAANGKGKIHIYQTNNYEGSGCPPIVGRGY